MNQLNFSNQSVCRALEMTAPLATFSIAAFAFASAAATARACASIVLSNFSACFFLAAKRIEAFACALNPKSTLTATRFDLPPCCASSSETSRSFESMMVM